MRNTATKERNKKRNDFVMKHFDFIYDNKNELKLLPAIREVVIKAREELGYSLKTHDADIWRYIRRTLRYIIENKIS